jgi:uncharacterized membrane protein YidH (DUF202 family)
MKKQQEMSPKMKEAERKFKRESMTNWLYVAVMIMCIGMIIAMEFGQ